jgi:hypothetical protein
MEKKLIFTTTRFYRFNYGVKYLKLDVMTGNLAIISKKNKTIKN